MKATGRWHLCGRQSTNQRASFISVTVTCVGRAHSVPSAPNWVTSRGQLVHRGWVATHKTTLIRPSPLPRVLLSPSLPRVLLSPSPLPGALFAPSTFPGVYTIFTFTTLSQESRPTANFCKTSAWAGGICCTTITAYNKTDWTGEGIRSVQGNREQRGEERN